MEREDLLKLIEDDDLGLLKVKPRVSSVASADERLISSFEEINKFIAENSREPKAGSGIQEHQLYSRLKGIRESQDKMLALKQFDVHNLLDCEVKEINSISDIFEDDDLGILDDIPESIFMLKHVKPSSREAAEYISKRKKCADFDKYEHLFPKVHEELRQGYRTIRKFNDKGENLQEGHFYVLSGMLLYLEQVDITSEEKTVNGKRYRKDGRTRCIFENGTESDMLYRSLAKALYQDGRIVTEHKERLLDEISDLTDEDEETGYIYVVKSLSESPEISSIKNLYKIGFSSVPVEQRIKNAEREPTYLMAPVLIVSAYRCFNMNPQKLEQLLHNFFGSSCLNIDVYDANGKRFVPREWFVAPFGVIEKSIELIINGEIIHYKFDVEAQIISSR